MKSCKAKSDKIRMPRYLVRFRNTLQDFQIPELEASAEAVGVPLVLGGIFDPNAAETTAASYSVRFCAQRLRPAGLSCFLMPATKSVL